MVLLLVIAGVVYAGIGESLGLAIALTVVEAAGLLFIVVVGIPSWHAADYVEAPNGLTGVWSASALIFLGTIP